MGKLILLYHIIKIYIYPEKGKKHHEPHVNVIMNDSSFSGNIAIKTGKVLNGNLKAKHIKLVREFLEENKDYALECWEKASRGEHFDQMEDKE